jgi:hypothetical protein
MNTKTKHIKPWRPVEIIKEDFLSDYGLTQSELARSLGIPQSRMKSSRRITIKKSQSIPLARAAQSPIVFHVPVPLFPRDGARALRRPLRDAPAIAVLANPVQQRSLEADVVAKPFRFQPFVTQDFLALRQKFLIQRRPLHEVVRLLGFILMKCFHGNNHCL